MELIHIEEEQLNECLSLLFRNYLLFESREEFADAISFPALLNNNPISKLPYSKKLEAFLRFQKENPVEYAGYKTLYGLLSAYSDTSEFYYQHLWGKTFVNGYETAWRMAKAISRFSLNGALLMNRHLSTKIIFISNVICLFIKDYGAQGDYHYFNPSNSIL